MFNPEPGFLEFDLPDNLPDDNPPPKPQQKTPIVFKTKSEVGERKPQEKYFELFELEKKILITSNPKLTGVKAQLSIDLESFILEEHPHDKEWPGSNKTKSIDFDLMIGFLTVENQSFIVLANQSTKVAEIGQTSIRKIDSLYYYPIGYSDIQENRKVHLKSKLNSIKTVLETHGYYGLGFDISNRLGTVKKARKRNQYMINADLMADLKVFGCNQYIVPVILGSVYSFSLLNENQLYTKCISITRCSVDGFDHKEKNGFLDELGNSGKFAEIENIYYKDCQIKTKTVVKGILGFRDHHNVEEGLPNALKNSRKLLQEKIFLNHVNKLTDEYGAILIVNTLDLNDHSQSLATETIEEVYKRCRQDIPTTRYKYKNVLENGADLFIPTVFRLFHDIQGIDTHFGFRELDSDLNMVCDQKGVFRVNCKDGICVSDSLLTFLLYFTLQNVMEQQNSLQQSLEHLIYHGIPATLETRGLIASISEATSLLFWAQKSPIKITIIQEMPLSLKLAATTLQKYQAKKMKTLELFLKVMTREQTGFFIEKNIQKLNLGPEYKKKQDYKVQVVTWNVGGFKPPHPGHIASMLRNVEDDNPDLVVITLQEIFEMKGKNITSFITSDQYKGDGWKEAINQAINNFGSYQIIEERTMVGIYCILLAAPDICNKVKRIEWKEIKLGLSLGGIMNMGNKGSLVLKFSLDGSKFEIAACHFAAGQKLPNNNERISMMDSTIVKGVSDPNAYRFIVGDLNFRLGINYETVVEYLNKYVEYERQAKDIDAQKVLDSMLTYDQLLSCINCADYPEFQKFTEARITFKPTYKMLENQDDYKPKKTRTPSWTDRILFSNSLSGNVKVLRYDRTETFGSDHRQSKFVRIGLFIC